MTLLEDATLAVHVAAGFLALFTGAGAIVTEKGGLRHRRLGRTYVYAMAVVSVTALGLLAFEQSLGRIFLGLVAVFSFYFAFSGYRVLSRKRAIDRPGTADWVAVGLLGVTGVGLVGMGVWYLLESTTFGVVMLVFGGIALTSAAGDVRQFRATDLEPRAWFFEHLQRMGGAYIATTTAFVSVNATFVPLVARWLLPAVVGGVAIWYVSRRYERQFGVPDHVEPAD
jgi:uncharacterized membrane protein